MNARTWNIFWVLWVAVFVPFDIFVTGGWFGWICALFLLALGALNIYTWLRNRAVNNAIVTLKENDVHLP